MAEQMIFKRYEIKYMLTKAQFSELLSVMQEYMKPDEFGKSTNCSLYFDTPSFLLARRSMDHPEYKEKLRIRSYGIAKSDSKVFVELKKKFEKVTYKRRVCMTEADMERYLLKGEQVMDTQITREIDFCMKNYKGLAPAVFLSYDRQAFYGKNDHEFRMTFDENIRWRDYDLSLTKGYYGKQLLTEDQVLLEVKVANAFPKWLVDFLNGHQIYRTSFSKYSNAYTAICANVPQLVLTGDGLVEKRRRAIANKNRRTVIEGGLIHYA